MKKDVKKNVKKNNKAKYLIITAFVAVIIIGVIVINGLNSPSPITSTNPSTNTPSTTTNTASASSDLIIKKSEISTTAKFYPYKVGNTKMEIVAFKASDGTIRTAFNTCQVCFNSGRGYYVQQGEFLVCQNCGNKFRADQVEKIKGGCNPVPITSECKKDDGTNIVISKDFLVNNKALFSNWKKQ